MDPDLSLDLSSAAPPFQISRQSPASGLPPPSASPGLHTPPPRSFGDYAPINPDIDQATPPRFGSLRRVKDPFKVSDADSPPVPPEQLSPTHVFDDNDELDGSGLYGRLEKCRLGSFSSDRSAGSGGGGVTSAAEDDSSVCSADSGELGEIDQLPDPRDCHRPPRANMDYLENVSPYGTYSKVNKPAKAAAAIGNSNGGGPPPPPTDLNQVAIGALDYQQLMSYFEELRESSA